MDRILETQRLVLREMSMDDFPAMRDIVCDDQTMIAWNCAWSEDECLAGLQKQIRGYQEDGFGRWAVVLRETDNIIGMCGLQYCETDKESVPEIGYLFNRQYWHNGYAIEAAIAVKHYAFDALKFNEVFSIVRDINYPSMNVAIRNGMTVRGRFIKHYRGIDMPHIIFSVRKDDSSYSESIDSWKAGYIAAVNNRKNNISSGTSCFMIRDASLSDPDADFFQWLKDNGFTKWKRGRPHNERVDWVYVNPNTRLYTPGVLGIHWTEIVQNHAITIEEFMTIYRIYEKYKGLNITTMSDEP